MPRRPPISTETSQAYATRIEFCRVFAENMDSMHLLSFLLTADQAKAHERFVFVMSVLERYSDQDCSVLLSCSRQDVGETRMRALLHVAESDRLRTVAPSGCGSSAPEEAQTPEVQLEPQF